MRAMANVNATIKETVSGIAVAKNFRQEESIFDEFDEANQTSYRVNVRRGLVLNIVFPTSTAGGLATASWCIWRVHRGPGHCHRRGLVPVPAQPGPLLVPDDEHLLLLASIQNGLSAAERVFALIDAEPAVVQTQPPCPALKGQIDFDHVNFHYKKTEAVLEDFDLHIRPAKMWPWWGIPARANPPSPS